MGDTTPFEVHDRLRYHERVAVQLGVPVPPSVADVDMGAHQWWWRGPLIDYAGLIDVPFAQHHWAVDFLDAYVYAEQRPDILHCHGAWASKSRLRSRPGYQGYVSIPGYPMSGGALHDGSFVRRDLLTRPRWDGPTTGAARFVGPVGAAVVPGWWLDGDRFAPGGRLPLTLGIQKERTLPAVRVYAFLASGADVVAVWEVPPAYDWLPAERWRKDEVVVTRHLLSLSAELPEGTYDLGLSVVSQRGGDPLVGEAVGETAGGPPRFAQGELVWAGAVTVAAPARVAADAAEAVATAVSAADANQCERATAALQTARGLGGADGEAPVAIGRCYAREQTPAALRWARRWAPTDPVVRAIGRDLADGWEADGDRAARAGDAGAAHQSWTDALGADPLRPWLRRRVEEARALRLAPAAAPGEASAPAGGGD
jgi:hypothetical protein